MERERSVPSRPYKLSHQLLCIKSINFQKQSLIGLVEINLIPQRNNIEKIKFSCKQCKIFRLTLNDVYDVPFKYNDPTLDICHDEGKAKQKSVDIFSAAHHSAVVSVDADYSKGEITVTIPKHLQHHVVEGRPIKITLEFGIERPLGGLHFVVPADGSVPLSYAERGAHVYSYGFENCSRLWFPCVDVFSEPCTWKMEFTVDATMVAVAPGDLLEVVFNESMKKKTYHYQLNTPTSASCIGVAIGPFEIMVDPNMHEVTHFCLPHLMPLLKDTTGFLHETFEFYEELLSTRYPYTCYKQVFVDEAYSPSQSYATMTVFDINLLHSKHIVDQTYHTRRILSAALAQQFFGCFMTMNSYADAWLTRGISGYLGLQYHKKAFGNNEYRVFVYKQLDEVIEYEQKYGGIVLDPTTQKPSENTFYFSNRTLHTLSPVYEEALTKKAIIVMRMLEDRIGKELFFQVFNKLLTLAAIASQQKLTSSTANAWYNMLLSTNSFTKAIFTVTGKDVATFLGQWVYQGGHAKFNGSFVFNRKRNTVELEIKQLDTTATGVRRYMGPLAVWVQELDGTFKHNLQIEDNVTKHDITCHSKSRRNKKKKIPLCTGEEVDMNLSAMDQDSPVLWIRIDPDMQLLRQVIFEQPDYQWQYQLRYERDVTAQQQAITEMEKYPTTNTREALMDIVQNEHCYYRVRCEAAMCLRAVANQMAASWSGPPAMMNIFKKLFGSFSCPNIIKLNNFTNFQRYYLQKAMPMAMAGLRSAHGICPTEVIRFLLDLFKYNDNSKNKFSDNYYRSALIEALAETVTPAVSAVLARSFQQTSSEALPSETKLILEEITRYFNLEKLIPCYKHTVTVSCLKAIRRLQKMGHLPGNSAFFKEYAQYGIFVEVRLAAIEALVDITRSEPRKEDLDYLLDLVETDPVPSVKINTLRFLVDNPPFVKKDTNHILNTEDVVERIWKMMNATLTHDTKLRCALVDLYFTLYGRGRPSCLPKPELSLVVNLKERKTISSVADDNSERTSAADLFDQIRDKPEDRKRPASDALQVSSEKRLKTDSTPDRSELFSGDRSRQTSETVHFQPEALASPTVVPSGSVEVAAFVDLSAAPTASTSHEPKEGREKEKKHKDKDRDKEGHSKPHKDKKKKKKKHKHKHKHKHSHGDREKEGKEKSEREERHSSVVSDEASNLSPKSDSN